MFECADNRREALLEDNRLDIQLEIDHPGICGFAPGMDMFLQFRARATRKVIFLPRRAPTYTLARSVTCVKF